MSDTSPAPIDALTIGQAREAVQRGKEIEKILSSNAAPSPTAKPACFDYGSPQIVILDRGFVFVGNVGVGDGWITISNAKNVRRWGTTKGLGELAKSGPQPNTVLDPAGTIRAPLRALIGLLECEASSWTK